MEYIISKIKDYVRQINTNIDDDDFLDYIVREVVDRAVVYMNRYYLIEDYEEEVSNPSFDVDEFYDEMNYRPLPKPLWRPLARTVIDVYREVLNGITSADSLTTGTTSNITSLKDNGQEIQYGSGSTAGYYLNNVSDQVLFSSVTVQLDNYRLVNTGHGYTDNIRRRDFTSIL